MNLKKSMHSTVTLTFPAKELCHYYPLAGNQFPSLEFISLSRPEWLVTYHDVISMYGHPSQY